MQLGPHTITNPVMLAPMAGMSDLPFREICRELGAGYAVGEMTTSKPELRESRKSAGRWAQETETGLKVVQLLGADPRLMADAARYAADTGADVVDINMGCPAKKVLQTACGSAHCKESGCENEVYQDGYIDTVPTDNQRGHRLTLSPKGAELLSLMESITVLTLDDCRRFDGLDIVGGGRHD